MADQDVTVIAGVGPGLGAAVARRFAKAGHAIALAARNPASTDGIRGEIESAGGTVKAYQCDLTDETGVDGLFQSVEADLGAPTVAVYNAGAFVMKPVVETGADEFIDNWKAGCFGGFLVGRAAARSMIPHGRGTIIFTGATAAMRGGGGFASVAAGKFGLRALAQSMARELGPQGIHVAHVVIDGIIHLERTASMAEGKPEHSLLEPDAIAENYYQLHQQHKSAWTQELDLRPWVEKF